MDTSTSFLSILFPAHNEELRLPAALQSANEFITKQNFACELVIIENASTDSTLAIAQEFARTHDYVTVVHNDQAGKGRAVQKGMLMANGAYRFVCDVDLSMPISEISHFLPPEQSSYDIAIASREAPGAIRYSEPFYRHLIGRMFNFLVKVLVLPELNDTQCGFKCFTAQAAAKLFPLMTITGWTFDVEILAIARKMKLRMIEIPIPWYYMPKSKIHVLRDSLHMATDLFLIRKNLRKGVYTR
jgi:glycosyltransferase involved in cell wall biosynthesis